MTLNNWAGVELRGFELTASAAEELGLLQEVRALKIRRMLIGAKALTALGGLKNLSSLNVEVVDDISLEMQFGLKAETMASLVAPGDPDSLELATYVHDAQGNTPDVLAAFHSCQNLRKIEISGIAVSKDVCLAIE